MLYNKSGRIYTHSFSFVLPEEMCIVTDPENIQPDTLTFETLDGRFIIELSATTSERSAMGEMKHLQSYDELVFMSEPFEVQRTSMKGVGIFYHSELWRNEYYEEYLDYPLNEEGQNMMNLCVRHEPADEADRNKVASFMELPNIKSFLDSIKYELTMFKSSNPS